MRILTYGLYDVATLLATPLGAAWLALHPGHRELLARFAPPIPETLERPIWVQACSVGEILTAKPIIKALKERWPGVPVALTVSTAAGYEIACTSFTDVPVVWFPFDVKPSVRRFVSRLNPMALVLVETELWPNVLRETRRAGAPVVLVNGRLSDKHFPRYVKVRRFLKPVIRQISLAGMQNDEYAARMVRLGADPDAVRVTGNTKFDGVATTVDQAALGRLREENGFTPGGPVLIFGSTRPGDEALAAACWKALKEEFPELRLVIAPRHLERVDEALSHFDEPLLRRSEVQQGRRPAGERVFVLDTVGELVSFYAMATVAVIGGSFYPGVNGHNPLEPAALSVPTVFGPYMRNFIDPARVLVESGGARQLPSPDALLPALRELLADPDGRARMAARGREAVLANQGAIDRSLDLLAEVMS